VAPEIPEGFVPAQFATGFLDHSGLYFLKRTPDTKIIGCRVTEQHKNYVNMAHGGVLATLADVALSYQ
jgi:acyl-coenzyme A thioesterase PaaI-like protein